MTNREELVTLRKKVYNEILFNEHKLSSLDDSTIDTINDLLGLIYFLPQYVETGGDIQKFSALLDLDPRIPRKDN
jgi:hypothetical protein